VLIKAAIRKAVKMDHYGEYGIFIGERWSLGDLYRFPRTYEQVYFAFEAILPTESEATQARLERAFRAFPWRGGYSAVGFYDQLRRATPPQKRPTIRAIQYASPGFIELVLNLPLAIHIASVVASVAGSISICNRVYNNIHKNLQERKLLRIEVERKKIELSREEIALIRYANEEMAQLLGLPSAQAIVERSDDPLVALKILLSIYRRVRTLAEFKNSGKANLSSRASPDEDGEFW